MRPKIQLRLANWQAGVEGLKIERLYLHGAQYSNAIWCYYAHKVGAVFPRAAWYIDSFGALQVCGVYQDS